MPKDDRPTFEQWMAQVDRQVRNMAGIAALDLPDQPWHDWYDDETPPITAAVSALSNEGFPFPDDDDTIDLT